MHLNLYYNSSILLMTFLYLILMNLYFTVVVIKITKKLKSFTSIETNISDKSLCIWLHTLEDALINAFYHEQELGNMVGWSFTTHTLNNVLRELWSKFSNKILNKERIRNRMRNIKNQLANTMIHFKWEWADLHEIPSQYVECRAWSMRSINSGTFMLISFAFIFNVHLISFALFFNVHLIFFNNVLYFLYVG